MKKTLLSELEEYELHHRIISFVLIMILTIVIVRLAVFVHNPNPTIFNFELHHFDYGILLLMISTLLLLFGPKKYYLYLLLSGISFGLVLDDIWFIRKNIIDPSINEVPIYNQTFPIVAVSVLILVLAIILINHFKKKRG